MKDKRNSKIKILETELSLINLFGNKKIKNSGNKNDSIDSLSSQSVLNIKETQNPKYLNPISQWNKNEINFNNSI